MLPTALILLSVVPLLFGAVRLAEVAGGAEVTPDNARFIANPVPVVLHIASAVLYCVLGAFQFAPGMRRRRLGRHRALGRMLVPLGLIAGLSGLWMTLFYPRAEGDGFLLFGFRLVFGSAMVASIVLGFMAVRRSDIAQHSAWMIRGYAIGQGAGTQVLTTLPWVVVVGAVTELSRALLLLAGWVINVAVAEWVIRRRAVRPRRAAGAVAASPR